MCAVSSISPHFSEDVVDNPIFAMEFLGRLVARFAEGQAFEASHRTLSLLVPYWREAGIDVDIVKVTVAGRKALANDDLPLGVLATPQIDPEQFTEQRRLFRAVAWARARAKALGDSYALEALDRTLQGDVLDWDENDS